MNKREEYKGAIENYLRNRFGDEGWTLELPRGSGRETYAAVGTGRKLFVKLGVEVERVQALAKAGISPEVVDIGELADGTIVLVQEWVDGRHPQRGDYRERLEDVAGLVGRMHRSPEVMGALSKAPSEDFAGAGLRAVADVRKRWEKHKGLVGSAGGFVDEGLEELEGRMRGFSGGGLVASHNDLSWDNWLFGDDGRIFVIDPDMMGPDDPALDVGITLWWYYAPELWGQLIECAGYEDVEEFRERMWARIALHCLRILLPRPGSFDRFDASDFWEASGDFRAALRREGNPQM